jgi:hypothetical protein
MPRFNPGDVAVTKLQIVSPRTSTWDFTVNFLSCTITETIFTPGVQGTIEVIDYDDLLGKLKIAGDEEVMFNMQKPNGLALKYNFHLNSVQEVEVTGTMKAKIYKLEVISREVLKGQAVYAQKGYNQPISEIVQDMFKKLDSKLPIQVEQTKGKRNFKVVNQPVFHAIETLRKESVSQKNKTSNYMFWQTWRGFYFKTLEGMMQGGDVKRLKQDMTVGYSIYSDVDSSILAWKVNQTMDAIKRLQAGTPNQRVTTFNINTNQFRRKDFKDVKPITAMGAGTITALATFNALFPKANRTVFRYVNPNPSLNIEKSHVPETIPDKMMNLAQMQEQQLHLTTIGDPVLEAGKTVYCTIPKAIAKAGMTELDPVASGRWLISKVEHNIRRPDVRPRYICHLECLKGAYQERM